MAKQQKKKIVTLEPLKEKDEGRFVDDLQAAFQVVATELFGPSMFYAISALEIFESLDTPNAKTYNILLDGVVVGGLVVIIDRESQHNTLDLMYVDPKMQNQGIGFKAWKLIEARYRKTRVWKTQMPYFDERHIHFYVNKCGFHMVEFMNAHHKDPLVADNDSDDDSEVGIMYRFEKDMHRE